jgi:hypothetical protein
MGAYTFSADELNANFTTPATSTGSHLTFFIVPAYGVIRFHSFVLMRYVLRYQFGRSLLTPLVWTAFRWSISSFFCH